MKINSAAAYQYYKTYAVPAGAGAEVSAAKTETGAPAAGSPAAGANTDKVSFSARAAQQGELGKLSQSIAAELAQKTPETRLQELKTAVEGGEYYIPTAALAETMLRRLG